MEKKIQNKLRIERDKFEKEVIALSISQKLNK
jgi:hypothetical protein